jgi:hypothetical protein
MDRNKKQHNPSQEDSDVYESPQYSEQDDTGRKGGSMDTGSEDAGSANRDEFETSQGLTEEKVED